MIKEYKNLEELVSLLGTRKDSIKRFLCKHFKKDIHYEIRNKEYSKENKEEIHGWRNKELILVDSETFDIILQSYNLKNRYVSSIKNVKNPFLTNIESNTLGFIERILHGLVECKRQFKINDYFIDLYIPSKKLAIECDEFAHKNYNKVRENIREKHIKEKLHCTFLRFDPCSDDFCFDILINKILLLIFEKTSNPGRTLNERF